MQDVSFRSNAAAHWHWVAAISRNPDLSDLADQSTKTLAHPGFVGSKYCADGTGTLVIGMNPGGGGDTPDLVERQALLQIRDQPSIEAFDNLNDVAAKIFRSWPIWKNNLIPLLESVEVDAASVAYIHAVPFRVADNSQLAAIYADAWQRVSSKQCALLRPGRILLAGKTAGSKIQRYMPVKSRIVVRSIGDTLHARKSAKISDSHQILRDDAAFWS